MRLLLILLLLVLPCACVAIPEARPVHSTPYDSQLQRLRAAECTERGLIYHPHVGPFGACVP